MHQKTHLTFLGGGLVCSVFGQAWYRHLLSGRPPPLLC